MKKTFLAAAMLACSGTTAIAQSGCLYLRTGIAGMALDAPSSDDYNVRKMEPVRWPMEAGYGWQRGNGLRIDIALQQITTHTYAISRPAADYGGTLDIRTNVIGLRFGAGYDLMQIFSKNRDFLLNAAVSVQPAYCNEKVAHDYVNMGGDFFRDRYTAGRITAFAGVMLNPEYRVAENWWLTASLGVQQRLFAPVIVKSQYDSDLPVTGPIYTSLSIGISRTL